jgi:hypothetical protein
MPALNGSPTMPRHVAALLLSLAGCVLLAGPAGAQLPDATPNPGDRFEGSVSSPTDVDLLRIETLADTQVTVVVAAKKSSLRPTVEVVDLTTDLTVDTVTAKKKRVSAKVVVPSTGRYMLRISGADDTTGDYVATWKERLDKSRKKLLVQQDVAGGAELQVPFDAADGFELTAAVQRGKGKSPADPAEPTLTRPTESVFELPADPKQVKVNKKGDRWTLKRILLDATGTWSLGAVNEGDAGGLKAKASLRRKKQKKRKLEELPSGETITTSLSGVVLASNDDLGLGGVTVTAGELTTQTDPLGRFVLLGVPVGEAHVHVDGATATNGAPGASYGALEVEVAIEGTEPTNMPQVLVLPDLNNPEAATDDVATDGGGATTAPIDIDGAGDTHLGLAAPTGTVILVDGAPSATPVTLSVVPVPARQVPMALEPESGPVDAASYVTIQPANASFDTTGGVEGGLPQGLDVVLPNERGFPVGTMVDVWSFDHDVGDWVNRSEQTGNQGVVVDNGDGTTRIDASGVILAGGWHSPVLELGPAFETEVVLDLVDQDGNPIANAWVRSWLGQFAQSDESGQVSMPGVNAYWPGDLATPTPIPSGLDFTTTSPVDKNAVECDIHVDSRDIVLGGVTDLGTVVCEIPVQGTLVLRARKDNQLVPGVAVTLTGPETVEAVTDDWGALLRPLDVGLWTAAITFEGNDEPTAVIFEIRECEFTFVDVQDNRGQGEGDVTVRVMAWDRVQPSIYGLGPYGFVEGVLDDCFQQGPLGIFGLELDGAPVRPWEPLGGAAVRLQSGDGGPGEGLVGFTNVDGEVSFADVTPPYHVAVQQDEVYTFQFEDEKLGVVEESFVWRLGTSVVGVTPGSDELVIPVDRPTVDDSLLDLPPEEDWVIFNLRLEDLPIPQVPVAWEYPEFAVVDAASGLPLYFEAGFPFFPDDGIYPGNAFELPLAVPAGRPFDLVLRHRREDDFAGGFGGSGLPGETLEIDTVLAALRIPDLDPATVADPYVVDWDDLLPFDQQVALDVSGLPDNLGPEDDHYFSLRLVADTPERDDEVLAVWYVDPDELPPDHSLPPTLALPDPDAPSLAGLEPWLEVWWVFEPDYVSDCSELPFSEAVHLARARYDDPTGSLELAFGPTPAFTAPGHCSELDPTTANDLLFLLDDGAEGTPNGFVEIVTSSDDPSLDTGLPDPLDHATAVLHRWFVPFGTTEVDPNLLPLGFHECVDGSTDCDNDDYLLSARAREVVGVAVDWEALFGPDAETAHRALRTQSTSSSERGSCLEFEFDDAP